MYPVVKEWRLTLVDTFWDSSITLFIEYGSYAHESHVIEFYFSLHHIIAHYCFTNPHSQGSYSPTILKDILFFFFPRFLLIWMQHNCWLAKPYGYGLANQMWCYIQMLLNIEKNLGNKTRNVLEYGWWIQAQDFQPFDFVILFTLSQLPSCFRGDQRLHM